MQLRLLAVAAVLGCSLSLTTARAQDAPSAPAPQGSAAAGVQFPASDPANFTAASPSKETVEGFLKATWGYDTDRVWQVQAIEKTEAPGVSRVVVLAAQKSNPQQTGSLVFFVTPDGNHLIASDILPFGAHPFDERFKVLQAGADGPSRGGAGKGQMLVEFADFECPHCKEAQPNIKQLQQDFPQAKFVYENFPLESIHSEARKAAEWSTCAAKLAGNEGFFKFADAVFANQDQLQPLTSTDALKDASTKAGLDPAKMEACSLTPDAKAAVDKSVKLGKDLEVNQTPTLYVNGRSVPLGGMTYDQIKQIVAYQFQMDAGK